MVSGLVSKQAMEEPADLDPPDSPRSGGETPPESPRSIASLEPNGDELEIDPEMASKVRHLSKVPHRATGSDGIDHETI